MVKLVEKWQSNRGELFDTEYEATVDELRDLLIDCGALDTTASQFLEKVIAPLNKLGDFVNLIQRVHLQHPAQPRPPQPPPTNSDWHSMPRGDSLTRSLEQSGFVPPPPPLETHHRQRVEQKYGV